ncbi:ATP-binding protein [Cyclobacterium marinum]|uniref:ATP-binding protein n=1 Tax=Cyclobacterium marinum TaxID=104 RepID=UPI001A7E9483|nr:ATP-binding protein [Cyclobacterium marinum]
MVSLDNFGLNHLEKQHQIDLMEIIEGRHTRTATLKVIQLPVGSWFEIIGEATIADAVLDRLV